MSKNAEKLLEQLFPFILLGIGIALVIGLLIMFSYVLVWGVIIGAAIWLGYFIKEYFFSDKKPKNKNGRIIEHNDRDE